MNNADMAICVKMLKKDEEFRGFAYDDATGYPVKAPVGNLTIGIGLNIQDGGISKEEASYLLRQRILKIETKLSDLPFWETLDIVRKFALINMAYNLGVKGFLEFKKMLKYLDRNDYDSAADEVIDSNAAKQLQARYQRIAAMVRTGKMS